VTASGMNLSHDEAVELAGLYVLDALETDERAAVDAHLATCGLDHAEFADVGGVAPALASVVEPVDAPALLKQNVMAAYARDTASATLPAKMPGRFATPSAESSRTPVRQAPVVEAAPTGDGWRLRTWAGWATAVAAVLILAVVGVYTFGLQTQLNASEQQAAVLSDAIAAYSAPGSATATLRDSGGDGVGFAAVSEDGTAYVVASGLDAAPAGKTYQAWFIADGTPVSAGLASVGANGLMVMSNEEPAPGTTAVALTLEPTGGSDQPTTDPFVVGELQAG
jgi:anti-sigma-K factor RskA